MSIIASDELTESVVELRTVFPEMRLGQHVLNLATVAGAFDPGEVWDIEDTAILAAARRLLERNRGRAELNGQPSVAPDGVDSARFPLS